MSSTNPASTSSSGNSNGQDAASANTPALPPNVSIFSPADPSAAKALLNGRMFTRLTVSAQTEPSQLSAALKGATKHEVSEAFCLSHRNVVLLFDSDGDNAELEDTHHEHFRLVCLALRDSDISLDVAGCIFDTPNVLQAGFQLDELSGGAVLVIDLMGGEDDDDSDDDDSDDENPAGQGFLLNGDSGAALS